MFVKAKEALVLNKKAQSVIEYTTMIMLVAAAIIVMGPYISRSVNAQLKMWEDKVNDAVFDEPEPADPSHVPIDRPPIEPPNIP